MSHWIRADETPSAPRFYYFEKEFDAPKGATLKASSCGDTRYVLYLNGHLVSEGPCQGSQYVTYYETEDLTPYLVEGKNKLTAKVLLRAKDMDSGGEFHENQIDAFGDASGFLLTKYASPPRKS